jgi:hypothetical protein
MRFVASGATHDVTLDATNLMDVVSLSGSDEVHVGNGQGLCISSDTMLEVSNRHC